jgi:predicted transcriptional regulator
VRRLTISLREEDYEGVASLAKAEERSLNWIIARAIKAHLSAKTLERERPIESWERAKERRR